MARFAVANPDRVLGVVLINCIPTPMSLFKYYSEKLLSWRRNSNADGALGDKAEQFLILHKFGGVSKHIPLSPAFDQNTEHCSQALGKDQR